MSLNAGWKFTKDDPKDAEGKLAYAKIKDWVTQTGQSFLKEPKQPATKPEGELGADVSYTKSDFDDSAWRKLNLPHDWGIEGPFKQEYPGDTGKLPWWGVGWYRKHFTVPAAIRANESSSTSTAPCPTPPSGSTANSSAAGPMAIRPADSISRRTSSSAAKTCWPSASIIRPIPRAGIPAAESTAMSGW